jgi:hydrogenase maturation protease
LNPQDTKPALENGEAPRRALIVAYGNPYRRDDGVGLAVVNRLRQGQGRAPLAPDDDGLDDLGHPVDTISLHQLLPEMAETLAQYACVVFVDAHTGVFPEAMRVVAVAPEYGFQAVTHHMSPAMLLSVTGAVAARAPTAHLASIRGHDFDFGEGLSDETLLAVDEAAERVQTLFTGES